MLRHAYRDYIDGFYCGLASKYRKTRLALMFKAFIDESLDGNLFVMAGYIASVPDWMTFSDEWQNLLEMRSDYFGPPLNHFHMTEIAKSPIRMEQAALFYRAIENHVTAEVSVIIPTRHLSEIVDSIEWHPLVDKGIPKNPYYMAYNAIMTRMAARQEEFGITQPIDFIFDERSEKTKILDARDVFKRNAAPEIKRLLGNAVFMDDAEWAPLQAADMLAWWIRKWELENLDWFQRKAFPWKSHNFIRGLSVRFDDSELRNHFLAMRDHINIAVEQPTVRAEYRRTVEGNCDTV